MKLYIKYMVSNRCKMAVKAALQKAGLHFILVDLGEIEIMEDLSQEQREAFRADLLLSGLELMEDKKGIMIEKIKAAVVEMLNSGEELFKINFSEFLSKKLGVEYSQLAGLFSEVQGITIGQFITTLKIERVKELILFSTLSITEIAWQLNYSSVAHLSNQFKKLTGLTPTQFTKLTKKIPATPGALEHTV